jgi:hypothetical protein
MWHFNGLFGGQFKSIKFENQEAELYLKSILINKITNLGILVSKWIAA